VTPSLTKGNMSGTDPERLATGFRIASQWNMTSVTRNKIFVISDLIWGISMHVETGNDLEGMRQCPATAGFYTAGHLRDSDGYVGVL